MSTYKQQVPAERVFDEDGTCAEINAELSYDTGDVYAIRLTFTNPGYEEPVEWRFARSLLAIGHGEAVGMGDVTVWPSPFKTVSVLLKQGECKVLFVMPGEDIRKFVREMYTMVPEGGEGEHVNVDAELQELIPELYA